jgi:hypothetical protein
MSSPPKTIENTSLVQEFLSAPVVHHQFAFYSKVRAEKDAFIRQIIKSQPHDLVVYVCPRVIADYITQTFPQFYILTHEDFMKKENFLSTVALCNHQTIVIVENVSRYTTLKSNRFNFMHRIRMCTKLRYLIDIVPFTANITKLYMPYSYLDREILQYANGYAFQYNYLEEDADGHLIRAHDIPFLANKIMKISKIGYNQYLPTQFQVVESKATPAEVIGYAARKEEMFKKHKNPKPIITQLCDFANKMHSRYDTLIALIEPTKKVVVYFAYLPNCAACRQYLKEKQVPLKNVKLTTYYTHNNCPIDADIVVLFEIPMNNRFFLHDVIADIQDQTVCYWVRNDAKADIYISNMMLKEVHAIDDLTRAMWKVQGEKQ